MKDATPQEGADRDNDRRHRPRVTVAVAMAVYNHEHRLLLQGRTVDLSTAGALVHGSLPVRVGDAVRIEISRGVARNPLSLRAEVVRLSEPTERRRQHVVAFRFTALGELDEAVLQTIIREAQR